MQRDQVVIAPDLPANESGSIEPGHGHADMTTRRWDRGRVFFYFDDRISPTIGSTTRFCFPYADQALCQAVDHDQVPGLCCCLVVLFLSLAVRSETCTACLPSCPFCARVTSGIVISLPPLPLHHLLFIGPLTTVPSSRKPPPSTPSLFDSHSV